ncbi:hypothetical protein P3W24_03870 [Luteibacter sp. PPL201]|uniref:Uncharacterized protein n=1 Tax=Luteibacter sahnii TaxID=3021977 RepID=A0ABT6B7R2_9GAMM
MELRNTQILASAEAISIGVDGDYVRLVQEDGYGEPDHVVAIPRIAFVPMLSHLMRYLRDVELEGIIEAAGDVIALRSRESSHD